MMSLRVCVSTIVFAVTSAGNIAFSDAHEPIHIADGQGSLAPKQPQACIGSNGVVHLVYGVGDKVQYCSSKNGGQSFEPSAVAFQVPNMSLGMRRGPRIAVAGKSIVVTAIGGAKGKGQDGDVLAWRSEDGGVLWTGPVRVNDVVSSAREGLHAMTLGSDGAIWCVWLDLRAMRTELYASQSSDGGASWSANALVYRSPEKSICECCHPSIAVDGKKIHVLFRNSLAGNRDMYIVSSENGGQSYLPAKRLGLAHWTLNACPMDGGMLAVGQSGKVTTVWRRAGELFFTSDNEIETSLGHGEQAWVTTTNQGPIAVWTEGRVGKLHLRALAEPDSDVLDELSRDAMIVSNGDTTIACWESIRDSKTSVVALRIMAN